MFSRREKLETEGIKSIDILIDMNTYGMLKALIDESGYQLENGEKTEGISGVITQLITHHIANEEDQKTLSRMKQRNLMLRSQVKYLIDEMAYSDEEVADLFKSKRGVRYTAKHNAKNNEWSANAIVRLVRKKRYTPSN